MDTVRIYVQVPQAFTAQLHPVAESDLRRCRNIPANTFDAKLVTTSNAVNMTSRSMLVELQADNSAKKFSPGTYCQYNSRSPADPNMVASTGHGADLWR